MEKVVRENILISWIVWHFYEMPKFLLYVWKNYINFGLDFFSVIFLFKTLFSPWRRYNWFYPKAFDVKEFFSTLISNGFSRLIGAICRIALIIVGIIGQIFILIGGAIAIILWLLMPFIIFFGILFTLTF